MSVCKRLADEVRPDDFEPKRISQHVRAGAIGNGLVDHIPHFDPAFVAADNGVDVLTHSLKQFVARCARSVVSAKPTAECAAKTSTPELICRGGVRVRCAGGRGVGGRWICSRKNP